MRLNASLKKDFALDTRGLPYWHLILMPARTDCSATRSNSDSSRHSPRPRQAPHTRLRPLCRRRLLRSGKIMTDSMPCWPCTTNQGLAPFKALAMDAGVNFTAGCLMCAHRPTWHRYDIASKPEASPESCGRPCIWQSMCFATATYEIMADNYLEKRMEDHARGRDSLHLCGSQAKGSVSMRMLPERCLPWAHRVGIRIAYRSRLSPPG